MGMEQTVTYNPGTLLSWSKVQGLLSERGLSAPMRMIDGQLALPHETPSDAWRELRLSVPGGMVTLRRAADRVTLVTWGHAEGPLLESWNALAWALAEAGDGRLLTPNGPVAAVDFLNTATLPAGFRR